MAKKSKAPFWEYVEGVESGKLSSGKLMKLAVKRFISDVDKKDYIFNYDAGYRVIEFIEKFCHHWKGPNAGKPFVLDPHQHFYLIQKYGWMSEGLPRFRRSLKMIARKTGKTTEAALEALFHMSKGIEESAQVFTCATKEDDAVLVVNDAGRIAMSSPALKPRFRCMIHEPYVRRVIFEKRNAFMTYMTKGHDGADISMGIGDECHDWPDASIRNRIELGMGNRLAPMFSVITTAGFNKYGYCYSSLRDSGIKILQGTQDDDQQLIVIFEMDEKDDWNDESKWIKANPNIPYSPTQLKNIQAQYIKAKNEGGEMEVAFKTKNLNMWTDASSVWVQDDTWTQNAHGGDTRGLLGRTCYGGLYTSSTESLNAFVLYFPGEQYHSFLTWTWIPEKFVSKNSDNIDYRKWRVEGHVRETPGNSADHKVISRDVIEIIQQYDVRVIGFDKTFGQYVAPDIQACGYNVAEIYQGFSHLAQQTEEMEKLAKAGRIEHFNNPVFRWQMSNTVLHQNSEGQKKPDKSASGSRIGVVSAALNAMAARFLLHKQFGELDLTFTSLK